MPMKLETRQIKPGVVVLEVTGRISMGNDCAEIEKQVKGHIDRDEKRVIFDLTGVNHIDSSVVGQIVKCHSTLKRSGGALRLAGVSTMVYGVLQMTHVDRVIEIYPTALDASLNF